MKSKNYKLKICVVGCGAIGSRIAKAIHNDFKKDCRITGLYDIDQSKVDHLVKSLSLNINKEASLNELIKDCDCMVEAVNAQSTKNLIKKALIAKKNVLAMSVGKILKAQDLFQLARKNKCHILLPSGAIAGLDAIKAASLARIDHITLTTKKPPAGLMNNPYLAKKGIDLSNIRKETVLFEGDVDTAVHCFPQNINVAATIALASQIRKNKKKIKIRIITSPKFKTNSHEIEMIGEFGSLYTKTQNIACPDNPKSSYLAVLSGLQTLKQYCTGILIGT